MREPWALAGKLFAISNEFRGQKESRYPRDAAKIYEVTAYSALRGLRPDRGCSVDFNCISVWRLRRLAGESFDHTRCIGSGGRRAAIHIYAAA